MRSSELAGLLLPEAFLTEVAEIVNRIERKSDVAVVHAAVAIWKFSRAEGRS